MFPLLFNHSVQRTKRYFKENRVAKLATIGLFLGLAILLMAGIYSFFSRALGFIDRTDYFNDAVLLYLYELFMFAVFLLIFSSALITGLFNLFTNKNHVILAVSPKFSLIPTLTLSRMLLVSLWPILVIVFPVLFAIAETYTLSFIGSLLTLISLALLVALAVVSALVLILAFAWSMLRIHRSLLRLHTIAFTLVIFSGFVFFSLWQNISEVRLNKLFNAEAVELIISDSTFIRDHFLLLPSHPMAYVLFSAGKDDISQITKNLSLLALFVAIATSLFVLLKKQHLSLWQVFQQNHAARKKINPSLSALIKGAKGPGSAIFCREIITFFRNPRGMTWFGFFCLIWLFQIGSMFILDHRLSERPTALPFLTTALQVAATIYFVSMFVLRFAFPAFSMDQKMSRIIQSAPINAAALFLGRVIFYVPIFSLLGMFFTIINTFVMNISVTESAIIIGSVFLATITVTLYGLALGALFPNLETDDPELLSTSLPGLGFIFTSLLYGSFMAYALRDVFIQSGNTLFLIALTLSIIMSVFAVLLPYQKLQRNS